MNATDLCYTPATELLALIRTSRSRRSRSAGPFLDRIERVNPKLNAFCTMTADAALAPPVATSRPRRAARRWARSTAFRTRSRT